MIMFKTLCTGIGGVMLILIVACWFKPDLICLTGLFFILLLLGLRGFLGEITRKQEFGFIMAIITLTFITLIVIIIKR